MRLAGLRVLDFCWIGAGAFVTRILADLGAEVIKVESRTHPDNLRLSGPHQPGAKPLEGSGYFASRNTSKKSIALNMSHPQARQIALTLASRCSIVSNNFRPGVMEKWGLGYGEVAAVNPSVIYLAMPMQGSNGPHRDYIGFGSTIAALCGMVSMAGRPGRPPLGTGTHYPDHVPNPGHALVAVLAAALHRARTGEGQQIELAQIESTVNMLGPSVLACAATGALPQTDGNRRSGRCRAGCFPAPARTPGAPSRSTTIGTGRVWSKRSARRNGCVRISSRRCQAGKRTGRDRGPARAGNPALLCRRTGAAAAGARRRGGEGRHRADVTSDPQLLARRYWHNVAHAEMGSVLVNLPPFFAVGEERVAPGPPPLLGEHTVEVASDLLGFDEAECRRLMDERVFY